MTQAGARGARAGGMRRRDLFGGFLGTLLVMNNKQQQIILDAMQKLAARPFTERRPGRSRLVYDKARRTIVVVDPTSRALLITAEDAVDC